MEPQFIKKYEDLKALDKVKDQQVKMQRGLDFETLINDIFEFEGSLRNRGYHTSDNSSEQIDGAIEVWHRILLVEVKWVKSNLVASELFSFIGKIENKFHGTLGVFISRNTLTENFINALNRGRRQNVIVIHGEDVDLLFQQESPPLTEYIEYCLKLLSYDNKTHFAFSEFIKGYESPEQIAAIVRGKENDFINKYLNRTDKVSKADLLSGYRYLDQSLRDKIYFYLISNFDKIWLWQVKELNSYLKYNYLQYFEILNDSSVEVNGTEVLFFQEKLPSSFTIFGRPEIFRLYESKFPTLDLDVKLKFETELVKELKDAGKYSNWEKENVITSIVEKLWNGFEVQTRNELKELYIYIELDNFRVDTFAQKKFAKKLLTEKMISKSELEYWLLSKLKEFIDSVRNFSEMDNFFYSSYYKIGKYLGLSAQEFAEYIDLKAKEIEAGNK